LMQQGYIDFLINQNPCRQAELSINSFCNYFLYNEQVKSKNFFPIEIITSANLGSYIEALN